MRTSLVLAVLLASSLAVMAQVRPPSPIPPPDPLRGTRTNQQPSQGGGSITVEGCLRGSVLEPAKDDVILTTYGAHEYDLRISRALNETLRTHQGHTERVIGTLEVPPDPDHTTTIVKTIGGKTQVGVGTAAGRQSHESPVISVKSVEHIAEKCGEGSSREPSPARTGSTIPVPQ